MGGLLLCGVWTPAQAQMLTGYRAEPTAAQKFEPAPPAASAVPAKRPLRLTGAPPLPAPGDPVPVDFAADNLQHDEASSTVSAAGDVRLAQSGRLLRADQMNYDLKTDTVAAQGKVVLTDRTNDVYEASRVQLNSEMRQGEAEDINAYLAQGGHFSAREAKSVDENTIVLKDAAYTPCDCETEPGAVPAWRIRAGEVTYNKDKNRIKYKNARFEVRGVPVFYTPYLTHSDGKVKQKSGLLTPGMGFSSQLGTQVTNEYYWAIGPDRDATLGVMAMTKKSPVGLAEYRQRFGHGTMKVGGSFTHSNRTDSVGGEEVVQDDETRGHFYGEARYDINDKWRAGADIEVTSDDQYLRQYDFSSKDVLENDIYAERFDGRDYAVVRAMAFQDVRVAEEKRDQPSVMPEAAMRLVGAPNALLGGRWAVEGDILGLTRSGGGQDMNRATLSGNFQRRLVSPAGTVTTVDLNARGDFYKVSDRDVAEAGQSDGGTESRFFPQAHVLTSWPLAKPLKSAQAVIEPAVAVTVAPNVNAEDSAIPNEDSQDAQIDALNLFNPIRFPGKDRIEDRSRVTYGVRSGLYSHAGNQIEVFAGQSHRLHDGDNPFPEGSGLTGKQSDYVGQITGRYDDRYRAAYRFQLGADDFRAQRHEFDGTMIQGPVRLNSRYLYATNLEGTDIDQVREQVEGIASVDLTRKWRLNTGALYNLGEDEGLRRAAAGLDYTGCCLLFSLLAERNYTRDSSGDSGTDIKFRLGLKNIGAVQSAGSQFWRDWGSGND